LDAPRFVLDGELVVPLDKHLSFDDLLQRIHPAASRIARLAKERPAMLIVFDLLVDAKGQSLVDLPLSERRTKLEQFSDEVLVSAALIRLSPVTANFIQAERWLRGAGDATDGVVAKRLDQPYLSGERAMQKVKVLHTADCVVGGFRYASNEPVVGSLLLGLFDDRGLLHHVGFCSGFKAAERKALLERLRPLMGPPGFTGQAPGGPSRWSTKRSTEWEPLAHKLVVEVGYDHFTGSRFRHGTRFMRWRPDKAPRQCTLTQVEAEGRLAPLQLLRKSSSRSAPAAASAGRPRASTQGGRRRKAS
jgi:ATP-dependent DNA ligase